MTDDLRRIAEVAALDGLGRQARKVVLDLADGVLCFCALVGGVSKGELLDGLLNGAEDRLGVADDVGEVAVVPGNAFVDALLNRVGVEVVGDTGSRGRWLRCGQSGRCAVQRASGSRACRS